jgi:hypothetical protein
LLALFLSLSVSALAVANAHLYIDYLSLHEDGLTVSYKDLKQGKKRDWRFANCLSSKPLHDIAGTHMQT